MREITEDLKVGDKVRTRDGRDGRVLCTDLKRNYPIVVALTDKDGTEHTRSYYKTGLADPLYILNDDIFLPPKTISLDLYEVNKNGRVHYTAITKGDTPVSMGDITYIKTIETEIE